MMANGTLVRTLIHTDVTKYLSFKAVDGSFVFSKGKVAFTFHSVILVLSCGDIIFCGFLINHSSRCSVHFHQVHKVPATDMEALKSPLMGLFEKRRARNFFIYVQDYNEADPKTHKGLDLTRVTTKELIL
jgi:Rab GDP dissociation inhibitor